VPPWVIAALAGTLALILIVGVVVLRRKFRRITPGSTWGIAVIAAGADQGQQFSLRGERILIGRGQDPSTCITLERDTNISRNHGVLIRQGQTVYFEDTNSRNGSWVGEQRVTAGQRLPVVNGTLIRLGRTSVLRIQLGNADASMQTQAADQVGDRGEDPTHRR